MRLCLLIASLFLFSRANCLAQGRILMVDSRIDSVYNVKFDYHSPVNYDLNPVLKADRPWELNANGDPYAAPFSGGIWYDETQSIFKMWYSAGGYKKHGLITCLATSTDGKTWAKPSFDVIAGTNIVDTLEHDCCTVLLDKHESDPGRRYKMFNVRFDSPDRVSMVLKYSPDGIHWSEPVAVSGDLFDRCSAYYDPFRDRYVLSLKTKDSRNRRARNYLAHKDAEMAVSLAHRVKDNMHDRHIRFWFSAHDKDPRHPDYPEIAPAIYNHDAIAYESLLLGQFNVWQGPENKDCVKLNVQKRNEILLGFSEDGFNWKRECFEPFIGVSEDSRAWNAGNIQSSMGSPLMVGDSLYFYYSARYNSRPAHPSNFATGLATMRRDGFVSARKLSDRDSAVIITKPMSIDRPYLFINADAKHGSVVVRILSDTTRKELHEFSIAAADSTKIMIADLSTLSLPSTDKYRLEIRLTDASLYSFWLSDTRAGHSHGYTAGGGPGLDPSGIDQ